MQCWVNKEHRRSLEDSFVLAAAPLLLSRICEHSHRYVLRVHTRHKQHYRGIGHFAAFLHIWVHFGYQKNLPWATTMIMFNRVWPFPISQVDCPQLDMVNTCDTRRSLLRYLETAKLPIFFLHLPRKASAVPELTSAWNAPYSVSTSFLQSPAKTTLGSDTAKSTHFWSFHSLAQFTLQAVNVNEPAKCLY